MMLAARPMSPMMAGSPGARRQSQHDTLEHRSSDLQSMMHLAHEPSHAALHNNAAAKDVHTAPEEGTNGAEHEHEYLHGRTPAAHRNMLLLRAWLAKHLRVVTADAGPRRSKEVARYKALARTPNPMILTRVKMLLDRLQVMLQTGSVTASVPFTDWTHCTSDKVIVQSGSLAGGTSKLSGSPSQMFEAKPPPMPSPSSKWGNEGDDNGGSGHDSSRLSIDKVADELCTTFAFISEFLRKLPEETRLAACLFTRLESYKKDQCVYRTGDEADKFYIILAGSVEVWLMDPPHSRILVTTFRKGSCFGEQDMLNNELRNQHVIPASNCTFLTMHNPDFLDVFGEWFASQQRTMFDFFASHVPIFSAVSQADMQQVVRHMMLCQYPAGKEWEPHSEGQLYFMRKGTCTLETLDRKAVQNLSLMSGRIAQRRKVPGGRTGGGAGGEEALPISDSGILANVAMVGGRVVGTLGHEEELRRLRRAMVPRRTIATLEPGSYFGGGPAVMGDGDMQTCLKVTSEEPLEVYVMPATLFFKAASPDVVRALRDDVAFKLTYYYGRVGTIGLDTVVGHSEATLQAQSGDMLAARESKGHGTRKDGAKGRRPGRAKSGHVPGELGPEVQRVITYMAELKALDPGWQPDQSDPASLATGTGKDGGASREERLAVAAAAALTESSNTPAERFWSHSIAGTREGVALVPLLTHVYPQGLAPLADKIDELIDHTVRRSDSTSATPLSPTDASRIERIRPLRSFRHMPSSRSPSAGGLDGGVSAPMLDSSPSTSYLGSGGTDGGGHPARSRFGTSASMSAAKYSTQRPHTSPMVGEDSSGGLLAGVPSFRLARPRSGGGAGARLERLMTLGGRPSDDGDDGVGGAAAPPSPPPLTRAITRSVTLRLPSSDSERRVGAGGPLVASSSLYNRSMMDVGGEYGRGDLLGAEGSSWPANARESRRTQPGSLAAAGLLWEKTSEAAPPSMRQCLTYGEIKVRGDQKRAIFSAVKSQSIRM